MNEARFEPPLSADDPRLGEWLDGRLPEAEAAEVARLVAASPELTRLMADLRRQKAALAALPVSPPPAGFVGDVLAALDADLNTAENDAAVEAEWRRIERERLEEEIAEARAGAAEPADEPMRHRWPWMVLVGALAAGLLTAIVINRPGDREVALAEGQRAEGERRERRNENSAQQKPQVRTVTYRIRTAADRKRLEDLVAASGGEQRQAGEEKDGADAGKTEVRSRAKADGSKQPELPAVPSAPLCERIVISGPATRIAGLAAALEAAPARSRGGPAPAPVATGRLAASQASAEMPGEEPGENPVMLVIEIVDESALAGGEGQP